MHELLSGVMKQEIIRNIHWLFYKKGQVSCENNLQAAGRSRFEKYGDFSPLLFIWNGDKLIKITDYD